MAAKKRRTQRDRAEAWARDVANLDTNGRVYLFAPDAGGGFAALDHDELAALRGGAT